MGYITKQRLLQLIKEATMFSPATNGQPNSWSIINGLSDYNNENLGYIAEDLTGSDVWTRFNTTANSFRLDYPMVNVVHMGASIDDVVKHTFRVMYVDRVHREKIADGKRKSDTEILDYAVTYLQNISKYLSAVYYFTVTFNDDSTEEGFFNLDLLDYLLNEEYIKDYTPQNGSNFQAQFTQDVSEQAQGFRLNYISYPVTEDLVIGAWAEFTVGLVDCEEYENDFFIEGAFDSGTKRKIYAGS